MMRLFRLDISGSATIATCPSFVTSPPNLHYTAHALSPSHPGQTRSTPECKRMATLSRFCFSDHACLRIVRRATELKSHPNSHRTPSACGYGLHHAPKLALRESRAALEANTAMTVDNGTRGYSSEPAITRSRVIVPAFFAAARVDYTTPLIADAWPIRPPGQQGLSGRDFIMTQRTNQVNGGEQSLRTN